MYQYRRFNNKNGFFQKFGNLDYILLSCLLILGFVSLATMYSTDGGEVLFHTRSHFIKFVVFFSMMLVISFINIKFWFSLGSPVRWSCCWCNFGSLLVPRSVPGAVAGVILVLSWFSRPFLELLVV